MARIEWVKYELDNWAVWKSRESSGSLGFPKRNILASEPSGGYREASIPLDEARAWKTDAAVESLRAERGHLHMTLNLIYLQGVGIREAAKRMARAESTIKANLDSADHAIAAWFMDRSERFKNKPAT